VLGCLVCLSILFLGMCGGILVSMVGGNGLLLCRVAGRSLPSIQALVVLQALAVLFWLMLARSLLCRAEALGI